MVQNTAQNNGRRKRGQSTAEGRQRQIVSRLNHGIRSRSPVLLQVESEAEWQQHLEGIRQSYAPIGEVEECLVHLIAYQFWRWIGRLIPYERDLSFTKMTTPPGGLIGEGPSSTDIQKVLSTPAAELIAQENAVRAQLVRYEQLGNGQSDSLVFSAPEVEDLVDLFHRHLTNGEADDDDEEDSSEEHEAPTLMAKELGEPLRKEPFSREDIVRVLASGVLHNLRRVEHHNSSAEKPELRPDIFHAVVLLSVPYIRRSLDGHSPD
jgi:hypothetical protein